MAVIDAQLFLSEGSVRNHLSAAIGNTGLGWCPSRTRTAGSDLEGIAVTRNQRPSVFPARGALIRGMPVDAHHRSVS